MCLTNITGKKFSDGTVVVYKVFNFRPASTSQGLTPDFIKGCLRSPFEGQLLTRDQLEKKALYEAVRGEHYSIRSHKWVANPSSYYEDAVMSARRADEFFVHAYADKKSALYDFYNFYSLQSYGCAMVKCVIPKGEAYFSGMFDGEANMPSVATRALEIVAIEEMFCELMNEENHAKYGGSHVFKCEGTPVECLELLSEVCEEDKFNSRYPEPEDCDNADGVIKNTFLEVYGKNSNT